METIWTFIFILCELHLANCQVQLTHNSASDKNDTFICGEITQFTCKIDPATLLMSWVKDSNSLTDCQGGSDSCFDPTKDNYQFTSDVSVNEFYLTVNPVKLSNAGTFTCSNGASVNDAKTISIAVVPSAITITEDNNAYINTLVATTECAYPRSDVTITWYYLRNSGSTPMLYTETDPNTSEDLSCTSGDCSSGVGVSKVISSVTFEEKHGGTAVYLQAKMKHSADKSRNVFYTTTKTYKVIYDCHALGNGPFVNSYSKCAGAWFGITVLSFVLISFQIGVFLECILTLHERSLSFTSSPTRVYSKLNTNVVIPFDISDDIRSCQNNECIIKFHNCTDVARLMYKVDRVMITQVESGYSVTADVDGKVELTIQNVEEKRKGQYSISVGGSPKGCTFLYIQEPCWYDCVHNYYCECRCFASTPCGACCNINGLPYWHQVLWASIIGSPVALGMWVIWKCRNNFPELVVTFCTTTGNSDMSMDLVGTRSNPRNAGTILLEKKKSSKCPENAIDAKNEKPSSAKQNLHNDQAHKVHLENEGKKPIRVQPSVSKKDELKPKSQSSIEHAQAHDKKGLGLSANYSDDYHPLVAIDTPTQKAGALPTITDTPSKDKNKTKKTDKQEDQ